SMFSGASSFNQPLNNWDTSNVQDMSGMFSYASSFNQPLDNWNTSNVQDMSYMFAGASSFNQPLDNWNTSNVQDMSDMFYRASSFNQDLSSWNVSNLKGYVGAYNMFSYSGLSTANYDKILIGWANQSPNLNSGVYLGAANVSYCLGESARAVLTGTHNWVVSDAGKNCTISPGDLGMCGEINQPGVYRLVGNLLSEEDCLFVNSNNVVLNLNGFKVSAGGRAIVGDGRTNVSVLNGFIESSGSGVVLSNVQNSLVRNVSFSANSVGLNLSGSNNSVENSNFLNNELALSMTGNNQLLFSNSFGEIKWVGDLVVGGKTMVNNCEGMPFPECFIEVTKYSRMDSSTISIGKGSITISSLLLNDNPSLNSSVVVKFYDAYRTGFSPKFLGMGVSGIRCDNTTNPSCFNSTSLMATPAVFNASNVGDGRISLGFMPRYKKEISGHQGWNLVGFSNPAVKREENSIYTDLEINLSKGWNIVNYPVPNERNFREVVFIENASLANASREGKVRGGLVYYGKAANENAPSFKFVGVRNSGESTLRENRGYYIYAEENTTLKLKGVVPVQHEAAVKNYKVKIGDIHFINKSSGEVRNITRAVEVLNKSLCIPSKNNTISREGMWFGYGICYCLMNNPNFCGWRYTNSTIYWWDAAGGNPKNADFQMKSYDRYTDELDASKGVFVKFNYPDLAILLPGE
ncbi:MAG: BspA family leucine-rich repeat surface protein, partial [Candidatus Pacearchaeota archaeon]